jgi:hypothetical protein
MKDSYVNAVICGIAWAEALSIGDTFYGAMEAAKDYGYKRDTVENRLFVAAALGHLPNSITVDGECRIIALD